MLFVKGLTINLISISQLCDQGLLVNFSQSECIIKDPRNTVQMKGVRSKDNCYLWETQITSHSTSCSISEEEEVKLWHQKLGHLSLKKMYEIMSVRAITGIPDLKYIDWEVCGECKDDVQSMMSSSMLQHRTTSNVLELLHIVLMGPMQEESLS